MFKRISLRWVAAVVLFLCAWGVSAQTDGTYSGFSPYSVFGPGNLHQGGTAWNRGMGGVGIAARNHRFVNIINPASITARDSLSFMADLGLGGRASAFEEGDKSAVNTIFNIDNFVISFPLWRKTAMMAGLQPYSDVGYDIQYSEFNSYYQKSTFQSAGNGGLYDAFAAFAYSINNRLSVGVQLDYIFGNINKSASLTYADNSFRASASGDSLQVNTLTAKIGLQYEHPLSSTSFLGFGATYKLGTNLKGYSIHYVEQGSYARSRNETKLDGTGLSLGGELGLGVNYRKADKFLAELDYTLSNWKNSKLDEIPGFSNTGDAGTFAPGVGQSLRAGLEFTPNRNDIRYYFRRCTYRAGAYFEQSYYTVAGAHVNSVGLTLGLTLPVFRWYNGLSFGLEVGRRGLESSQVKENYLGFSVGFNVFDIWFQKRPYE